MAMLAMVAMGARTSRRHGAQQPHESRSEFPPGGGYSNWFESRTIAPRGIVDDERASPARRNTTGSWARRAGRPTTTTRLARSQTVDTKPEVVVPDPLVPLVPLEPDPVDPFVDVAMSGQWCVPDVDDVVPDVVPVPDVVLVELEPVPDVMLVELDPVSDVALVELLVDPVVAFVPCVAPVLGVVPVAPATSIPTPRLSPRVPATATAPTSGRLSFIGLSLLAAAPSRGAAYTAQRPIALRGPVKRRLVSVRWAPARNALIAG